MYIIAIGWLYVTTLMAFAESNIVAGVLTFFFYGLFPVGLLLWLLGTPARRQTKVREDSRRAAPREAGAPAEGSEHGELGGRRLSVGVAVDEFADQPDRQDAQRNQ
jgi:hypothetical protein